jgi:hypothetical protein
MDIIISLGAAWGRLGYFPNIWHPRTFNEFVLQRKLFFQQNIVLARRVTDKHLFKDWLRWVGFPDLVVPTQAIFTDIEQARRFRFTSDCAVKPTHSSGHIIIVRDRINKKFTEDELGEMAAWMREDYYLRSREINYRGLDPALIVEDLVLDHTGQIPPDIKIFCSVGQPFMIQVDYDRYGRPSRQLYDAAWHLLPYSQNVQRFPRRDDPQPRPSYLAHALHVAAALAAPFSFCRVDLYAGHDRIMRAGEITFCPGNGLSPFTPPYGDLHAGSLLNAASIAPRND